MREGVTFRIRMHFYEDRQQLGELDREIAQAERPQVGRSISGGESRSTAGDSATDRRSASCERRLAIGNKPTSRLGYSKYVIRSCAQPVFSSREMKYTSRKWNCTAAVHET